MQHTRRSVLASLAVIAAISVCAVAPAQAGRFAERGAVAPAQAGRFAERGAVTVAAGLDWNRLSPAERRALQREWDQATPERRRQLLDNVERLRGMSPEQQRALREQAEAFKRLSPSQRRSVCERYYRERGWLPPVCRGSD